MVDARFKVFHLKYVWREICDDLMMTSKSIENNDLDIVYPLNPLFLSSVDKLLTSASVFFIAFVCLQEFLFQFNDNDYVGDDAVENQGNALVKAGCKYIINWPEYLSIINWLEYLSIYQFTWTRTMLSSVLFWVLQVKTKLPIDLPLNEKYFNFYVDFF